MNDELCAILFAYLEAYEQDPGPKLEEWVEKYPQYSEDLVQFAVYHHVVERTALTADEEEVLANTALDIEQEALDQAFANFPNPVPLTSIVRRARVTALG